MHILHLIDFCKHPKSSIRNRRFDGMFSGKHLCPLGNKKIHLCHRKFQQNCIHNIGHIFTMHLLAVDRNHHRLIRLLHGFCQPSCLLTVRSGTVQYDDIRFADLPDFLNGGTLRFQIAFPWQFTDGSIRCDHNADCCMVPNNLLRPYPGSIHKGNFFLKPGRLDHPVLVPLHMPTGAFHHKADTVDQTHPNHALIRQCDGCRFLGNKLGLRSHNRLACCRLRQFIHRTLSYILIFYVRKHEQIHKAFDECGLSGPHRSDNTNVDFAFRPSLDVFI